MSPSSNRLWRATTNWRLRHVAGVLALVGSTAVFVGTMPASGRPANAVAGWERSAGNSSIVQRVRAPREREAEAQRMLALIRESLARGERATAETQFDILQGRHPDSDAYVQAQALLAAGGVPAPVPSPQPPPAISARTTPTEPPAEVTRREQQPATRSWSTEVRRVRALTQDFQASSGDRIFFGEASAELGSRARVVLAAQADWLKRFPHVPVVISAHADDRGSREFNEDLSIRRGEAVKARLIAEGVHESRIRVVPHGREMRIAPCDGPGCAAQNRRVVTIIGDAEPPITGVVSAAPRR